MLIYDGKYSVWYIFEPYQLIMILDVRIQGGDFTRGDGTGGRSIYGEKWELRRKKSRQ